MDIDFFERELNTSFDTGLSDLDAKKRIEKYGYNEIKEKKEPAIIKFLKYFWNPMSWTIEVAAILSLIIKHWTEFFIIVFLLFVNAIVGFLEERKAENILELLKKKMSVTARVFREKKWRIIPSKELVPGDIVRIRAGDIVPADLIFVKGEYLIVDESSLTGESLPVSCKKGDLIYSGSIVKKGEITGVVKATGEKTYFGKTIKLINNNKEISDFQKMIVKIGDYLIILSLILICIMVAVEIYKGKNILEIIQFSLILAVSSIPAALPSVLSITLAVGALNLARKSIIVKRLDSIEDLAEIDVLCSDKTGTLTINKLECGKVIPYNNFKKEDLFFYGSLASKEEDSDSIDLAILDEFKKLKINKDINNYKIEKFVPFDPIIKRTEVTISEPKQIKVTKGAPQVIFNLCTDLNEKEKKSLNETIEELAEDGYRVIAVALYEDKKWRLVGLIPLFDPPRKDAKYSIEKIKELGIKVKLITGDHLAIAKNISKKLNIGNNIVSITNILDKFKNRRIDHKVFDNYIDNADGFAEVFPEHKYKIVNSLQNKGHYVAMTGDGVNDAPALKKANCGIAVCNATDAARASSDIILLSEGISVITDMITEARKIFQRIKSYIIYRITETVRILLFIELSILVFGIYPINSLMIILLLILNDIPILAISYDNVVEQKFPERYNLKNILIQSTILGITGVISSFLLLFLSLDYFKLTLGQIQTLVFLKLILAGHSTILITRNKDYFWKKPYPYKYFLGLILLTDVIGIIISTFGILIPKINFKIVLFTLVYITIWMFINDFVKIQVIKRIKV